MARFRRPALWLWRNFANFLPKPHSSFPFFRESRRKPKKGPVLHKNEADQVSPQSDFSKLYQQISKVAVWNNPISQNFQNQMIFCRTSFFSIACSAGPRRIYSVGPVWMPYLILLDWNVKLCFRLSRTHFCAYVRSKTAKSQKCLYEIIPFLKISLGSLHTSEVVCPVHPAISSGEARRRKGRFFMLNGCHRKGTACKRGSQDVDQMWGSGRVSNVNWQLTSPKREKRKKMGHLWHFVISLFFVRCIHMGRVHIYFRLSPMASFTFT